jgi:hypothetical protein
VPDHWIPLVPRAVDGSARLERGTVRRADRDGRARGRILAPERERLAIHDGEVPREGARVTRAWQLARDETGRTSLWIGRRKLPGRAEGSGGLAFDLVESDDRVRDASALSPLK